MQKAARASSTLLLLLGAACGGTTPRPLAAEAVRAPELPVTRVVMYQNGIGYFERSGTIDGDLLTLQVRPSQINDMLKSLTVVDRRQGRAVSVSLPLEKTGAQSLAELPPQVQNAGGLLAVLSVFRGARVTVEGGRGRVSGRVLGVEQSAEEKGATWRLTLKTDERDLLVYPLEEIERIVLNDRTLDVGLDKSLDVSLDEGQWKPVSLSVRLAGDGPHDLLVSYIIEMPLWKPAYRVVVGEDGKALLQGWAVIDNVSGEDWNSVRLSLVAGTPMSFLYDLHAPQYMKRVDLTPRETQVAMAPVIERAGRAEKNEEPAASERDTLQRAYASKRSAGGGAGIGSDRAPQPAATPPAARMPRATLPADADPAASLDESSGSSSTALVEATGADLGALFRYDLQDQVSVPDRSSTLVSIVNHTVPGREVVLFRPEIATSAAKTHPYRAVLLGNDSGFTLEKGPVAIYAKSTFVGEGFVERMEAGTKSFLTYSIDGKVTLERSSSTADESVRLRRIHDGVIETEGFSVARTVYKVESHHEEPLTAFVKCPRQSGATLRTRPSGLIETADALFLPLEVAARGKGELTVEWATPLRRQVTIDTELSTQALTLYLSAGKVPPEVAGPLQEILKIKSRLTAIATDERELNRQVQLLSDDQERVRENLNLLRRSSGNQVLKEQLVAKMAKEDEELSRLSGKLVRYSEERAGLMARMNLLIGQVTLEEGAPTHVD